WISGDLGAKIGSESLMIHKKQQVTCGLLFFINYSIYENLRNVREAHLLLCAQGIMDFRRPWRKDRFRILDDP
ncbi:MAG: hypothetical protein IKJ04_08885, partial [Clostridia bacterium]|nr:hypothetical protein [Clostridia bacterium]